MRPTKKAVIVCLVLFLSGLGACFYNPLKAIVLVLISCIAGILISDFLLCLFKRNHLRLKRQYQTRYALGEDTVVSATITNRGKSQQTFLFYDGISDHCKHEGFPHKQKLKAGEFATISATLTFQKRGDLVISQGFVELASPLGFWWKSKRVGEELSIKVFPNYMPALNYGLLATANRLEQMGIVKKKQRGVSKEFHQLRDYQDGDSLNLIDWKASSRMNRVISREFQEERDQNILLVADCSMRTKAFDQYLPILDHLLNAMILISYMALKQGDKVSVMNFGTRDEDTRLLQPVKGNTGMTQILNHLYNYESKNSYGEYTTLAKSILSQSRKRSLVVILTNLRSEDQYGCVEALKLISQKHRVLLASVQESSVQEVLSTPIYTQSEADLYIGAAAYENDAGKVVKSLSDQGIAVMRSSIDTFGVDLANRYLDLRATISG